ncbi:MAG TPA: YggS family pyridoxal phosphate-dependent enzyme [Candidatus Obscuribacterales bacterium]
MASNLAGIREKLGSAPVTLVAVTKNVGLESMAEAFKYGVTEFGENRVQDALDKQQNMPPHMADKIRWHLIGHLQTNKVKKVVGRFNLIHSVDSLRLAEEISQEAEKRDIQQPVLIQVKVVADPTKSGFEPQQLRKEFSSLLQLKGISIQGLMTMAPQVQDTSTWHTCFCGLRDLRDELQNTYGITLNELSMGMTQDWQEAVNCGSTMIRLGRAIFGDGSEVLPRPS